MHALKNILFDLGVVLVHLQYEEALQSVLPLCDPERSHEARKLFGLTGRDPIVAEHECGRASGEDLFDRFVALTGFSENFNIFKELWDRIFSENEPMIRFARELSEQYNTYILTNAGILHVPDLYERFPSLQFFKGSIASYEVGVMKPDPRFYQEAMERFSLEPESCLFVDDRPENVEGARAFGLPTLHYQSAGDTISAIRDQVGIRGQRG